MSRVYKRKYIKPIRAGAKIIQHRGKPQVRLPARIPLHRQASLGTASDSDVLTADCHKSLEPASLSTPSHSDAFDCARRDSNSHPFRDGILSPAPQQRKPSTANDLPPAADAACNPACSTSAGNQTDLAGTIDAQLRQAGLTDAIRAAIVALIRAATNPTPSEEKP
jgi:hypothetical protein